MSNSLYSSAQYTSRSHVLVGIWLVWAFLIFLRLGYWQIWHGGTLRAEALEQYERTKTVNQTRGKILTSDGYELVGNRQVYRVFAQPHELQQSPAALTQLLVPLFLTEDEEYLEASESAARDSRKKVVEEFVYGQVSQSDKKWVSIRAKISEDLKKKVEELKLRGVGFDGYQSRYYPEASMAAHITGFISKNEAGEEIGYAGVEGALDRELRGKTSVQTRLADALGLRLFGGGDEEDESIAGRDLVLTVRRDVQRLLEDALAQGMSKYGAKAGEIIVMNPRTGAILGLAAGPDYEQAKFYQYEQSILSNPALTAFYEPGSTFKTLTVAAGLDAKVVTPETQCPDCDGPLTIGKYTINTWNKEYHPDITMTDALAKSDNTAMVFIAQELGKERFVDYLKKFGIGEELHLDLQEDTSRPLREKWGDIDLATTSFGQGITINSLQLMRAVSAIANGGVMMRPRIVHAVVDTKTGERTETMEQVERRVISTEAAADATKMLVTAAASGEAQWIAAKTGNVAGKTGTAQIPIPGGYAEDKTIASFIGFAPASDPQFIMIVKLVEPTSSPWAAETAAPLWYSVANKLFLLLNINVH